MFCHGRSTTVSCVEALVSRVLFARFSMRACRTRPCCFARWLSRSGCKVFFDQVAEIIVEAPGDGLKPRSHGSQVSMAAQRSQAVAASSVSTPAFTSMKLGPLRGLRTAICRRASDEPHLQALLSLKALRRRLLRRVRRAC